MLEEFQQRNIVAEDKAAAFKEVYKDPDEFCCLFVTDKDFFRFIYVPYPVEDEETMP